MTKPRLLDLVRGVLPARHYSPRTEETYVLWIKRFISFHGKKHPSSMGANEVNAFLTHLAVEGGVVAQTQNQALCAILFLYRAVLEDPLPWLDEVVRARPSVQIAGRAHAARSAGLSRGTETVAEARRAAARWRGTAFARSAAVAREGHQLRAA